MANQRNQAICVLCLLAFLIGCKPDSVETSQKLIPGGNQPIQSPETNNPNGFCGGDGSPEDPFMICNAAQLAMIDGEKPLADGSWDISMRGRSFKLKNDIDLAGVTPMAQAGVNKGLIRYFTGHLDGSNFKIRNWGSASQFSTGALIIMNSGYIHNVIFEEFDIRAGLPTGAFVGLNYAGGHLEKLAIRRGKISMLSGSFQPAGVVTGQNYQGLLNKIMVEDVSMTLLAGDQFSGGGAGILTGFNERSTIQDCEIHTSSIEVSDPMTKWIVGGAVGINQDTGVIKSIWATPTILSAGPFGNLVGLNLGGQVSP